MSDPSPSSRARRGPRALFDDYSPPADTHDEVFGADGSPHHGLDPLLDELTGGGEAGLRTRQRLADLAFRRGGITFSVYSDNRGVEKIFPFDLLPRPISAADWSIMERGLRQRVEALNLFLADVYGEQQVIADGLIPRHEIEGSTGFVKEVVGITPPGGVYAHISGIDLVRDGDGDMVVLEDNIRCPSGVSYVLENRAVMKRAFPQAFRHAPVAPVEEYPVKLREALEAVSPLPEASEHRPVILTPGPFNSAYFEHTFLARRTGCELVQGSDSVVDEARVFMKTTHGLRRVDVIYRRVDDAFLDPRVFREDSLLGVPGLFEAYAKGNVALANAIGNGVGDDKAIYPYVPELIRYYLDEDAILGQVPTYRCSRPKELDHVLAHLDELVVKAVDGAGGYGMLFGPRSTKAEREEFAAKLKASPEGYIAQPVVELSTCPVWDGKRLAPRRVDLRPYIITGRDTWVLPGGLTRVALVEGSYVVNSSQGGGSKDTWILQNGAS